MKPTDNPLLTFLDQAVNTDYPHGHVVHQYSTEGFKELFFKVRKALTTKDEHGAKPTDLKPGARIKDNERWTPAGRAAVAELKAALKKYYLNDNWLNAQELITGEIKADDFSEVFEVDGKVGDPFKNVETSVKRVEQYIAKVSPILKQMDDQVQALDRKIKEDTKKASADDSNAVTKVRDVVESFRALSKTIARVPKFPNSVVGNLSLIVKNIHGALGFTKVVIEEPKGIDTLPALDRDGIKKAAKLIERCYDLKNPLVHYPRTFQWLDHEDGSDFNRWIHEADEFVHDIYYDIFHYQAADTRWVEPIEQLIPTHTLASALEQWIDRSLK